MPDSPVRTFTPEQLLGPLNPLEQRHAPSRLFVAGHSEWLGEHPRALSVAYPTKHRALQTQLMREHLVVSQFPEGYPTTRRNFPLRNRTMALLCDASVIVEAGDGSGSLSQGWEALRLGRPLFLMASILEHRDLTWPKTMLDYGAMILKRPQELMDRLPSNVDNPLSAIA